MFIYSSSPTTVRSRLSFNLGILNKTNMILDIDVQIAAKTLKFLGSYTSHFQINLPGLSAVE